MPFKMADLTSPFLFILILSVAQAIMWPKVTISPIRPSGLKACIPEIEGLERFTFCGKLQPLPASGRCDYKGTTSRPKNSQWCVDTITRRNGTWEEDNFANTLEFKIHILINGENHTSPSFTKNIKEDDFQANTNADDAKGCYFSEGGERNSITIDLFVLRGELSNKNATCEKKLVSAKAGLESVAFQLGELTSNVAHLESDLEKSNKEIATLKKFNEEAIKMLLLTNEPKTNKLVLKSTIPLTSYMPAVRGLIEDDIGIDRDAYKIVHWVPVNQTHTIFELETYAQKVDIYLNSKVKLKHSKLAILNFDETFA